MREVFCLKKLIINLHLKAYLKVYSQGTSARNIRRLLEDVMGTAQQHNRHDHKT